ncbi:lipopolysaccharide biosynthesis protein [Leifsonia sp. NPDC102414]|uniref:lipopolysaccharide biosynthesis protein n=1 Tax=Leifsonia sp. NPDC102414 TaxID=3364124 RepID=UPI00381EEF85
MPPLESPITSYEPLNEPIPDEWESQPAGSGGRSSVALILGATVVSGLAGYVVTWRVFTSVGAAGYGVFSVFWSALFLVVGILFGLQQESTRAVAQTAMQAQADVDARTASAVRAVSASRRTSMWRFAAMVAVVVVLAVLATSLLWATPSLGEQNAGLAWFVAIGAGLNCLVAAASGVMAGAGMWRQLAAIVALDGVLRVIGVVAVLAFTDNLVALAIAVILPFPVSLAIVFASAPKALVANARVTIGVSALVANTGRTMLAASATAILINGFPLVLSFFSGPQNHADLGSLVLAVTLTRAPILVPLMALSSFLVSQFSHHPERATRTMLTIIAGIAAVIVVLCLAAWLWGVPVMHFVFGEQFDLGAGVLVALIASSGLIGALCVSGSAVLAKGLHGGYATGWVVASLVSLAVLFIPIDLPIRAALALASGPAVGLAVHLVWLRVSSGRAVPAEAASSSPARP